MATVVVATVAMAMAMATAMATAVVAAHHFQLIRLHQPHPSRKSVLRVNHFILVYWPPP